MNKSGVLSCGALLIWGLVLSGCGGGSSVSSSSNEPAVTQLTIQGHVAANALVDGELAFTIGTTSYKTKINEFLKYTITLDVPQQDINKPFVAVATGTGADSWVQLAASYPSIKTLDEKAGSDGVLTAEEYFEVNITTLTTAQYAEIKNQLIEIDSDEKRKNAFLMMHPIRSLEKSAFITKLLSDIDFKLPPPAKTTLDFLLDGSLSETYIEAFRVYDNRLVNDQIDLFMADSQQSFVSPKKLGGTYFIESLYYKYMFIFNEDGTGNLQAASLGGVITWGELPTINADFTWVRKGKQIRMTPSQPLVQYMNYYTDHGNFYYSCNDNYQSSGQCRVTYESFDIDLITDTEFSRFGYLRLNIKIGDDGDYGYVEASPRELSRIISANDLPSVLESDLIDHEWFASDYSYVFGANGTVSKTNLSTKNTELLIWELKGTHLIIGEETLWVLDKNIAGYDVLSVEDSRVVRKPLYKRTPVNMTESDWIGRWTDYPYDILSYSQDVNADKTWRDGFEAQGAGSWSIINNHSQAAISNGAWRMQRDVLAIHGDKYYMSICHGVEAVTFVPYGCYLSVASKATNFDTAGFWGAWSNPAFNEKSSGKNWISIGSNILQTDENAENYSKFFYRVASNKLFNRDDATIIEMTGASKDEIELCEYKLFESCAESAKRIYQRGIELKLTTKGEGDISLMHEAFSANGYAIYEQTVTNVLMVPKGYPQELIIKSEAGGTLNSDAVSGCGGVLVGEIYRIPALVEPCEIIINF